MNPKSEERTQEKTGELLRAWRNLRGLRQSDVGRLAGTSTRNLSFIETGRSRPSEELLERLCEVLGVYSRDRILLRRSAGFGRMYEPLDIDEADTQRLNELVLRVINKLEPWPALLVDRRMTLLGANSSAVRLMTWLASETALFRSGVTNISELVLSPTGLKPYLTNWDEVGRRVLDRMYREVAIDDPDGQMTAIYERWLAIDGVPNEWRRPPSQPSDPLFRFCFHKDGRDLNLYSLVTTLGTPADVTFQELRVRYFVPADAGSRALLEGLTRERNDRKASDVRDAASRGAQLG